jgi:hypothetical protein
MAKGTPTLTPIKNARKPKKALRSHEFTTIFINGKQKRVRRQPMIDGISADEFIRRNADPIWFHQHGMWEDIKPEGDEGV